MTPNAPTRGLSGGSIQRRKPLQSAGTLAVLYPTAREAVVVPSRAAVRKATGPLEPRCDEQKDLADAQSRRIRTIRRYVVANGLSALLTLSWARFAGTTATEVWEQVRSFVRRVRSAKIVAAQFPYVVGIDRGGKTGRIHAHLIMPTGDSIEYEACWPHGKTSYDVLRSDEHREKAATYLALPHHPVQTAGGRFYEVGRGFQPEAIRIPAVDANEALAELTQRVGRAPDVVSSWAMSRMSLRWRNPDQETAR